MSAAFNCDGSHAYAEGETNFEIRAVVRVTEKGSQAPQDFCSDHFLRYWDNVSRTNPIPEFHVAPVSEFLETVSRWGGEWL